MLRSWMIGLVLLLALTGCGGEKSKTGQSKASSQQPSDKQQTIDTHLMQQFQIYGEIKKYQLEQQGKMEDERKKRYKKMREEMQQSSSGSQSQNQSGGNKSKAQSETLDIKDLLGEDFGDEGKNDKKAKGKNKQQ